jgi:hypothetical protein
MHMSVRSRIVSFNVINFFQSLYALNGQGQGRREKLVSGGGLAGIFGDLPWAPITPGVGPPSTFWGGFSPHSPPVYAPVNG